MDIPKENDAHPLRFGPTLWMLSKLMGFIALTGLLGIVLLELGLRAFGFPSGVTRSIRAAYDLDDTTIGPFRAGARVDVTWPPETAYTATFNSLGCRGPEPRDVNKPAILCVGDSLTFGYGVDDEDTWPAQLDQRLDEEGLARPVINLSSGHLIPEDELLYVKRALDGLDNVGIVVLLMPHGGYIDPIHLMSETPHEKSKRRERERQAWPGGFYHNLAVYEARVFFKLWRKKLVVESGQEAPQDFQKPGGDDAEIQKLLRERYRDKIAEIKAVVEEKGALFVLAAYPGARIVGDRVFFGEPWSASIADELGTVYVDVPRAFRQQEDGMSLTLLPYDLHASRLGNEVIAKAVLRTLRGGGYLE